MDNEKFQPRVSVILPVYNGANYLRESIDSALAQTYTNYEIIVVNDGSMDGGKTETIALSYGNAIRYIYKKNGGVASALNAGIRAMTGDYFSWLSHDDLYAPNKLADQIRFIQNIGHSCIAYGDYYLIDDNSKLKGMRKIQHRPSDHFLFLLITVSPINGCTILIPRACFDDIGYFDERLKTTQDYDMWVRLSKKYRFFHIQKPDL